MVFLYHFWIVSLSILGRYVILVSVQFFCIGFVCHYQNAQSAQCIPFAPKSKLGSVYLCISPVESPGGGKCGRCQGISEEGSNALC